MDEGKQSGGSILSREITAGVEALEGLASREKADGENRVATARVRIQPLLEIAAKVKGKLEALEEEFGPYLERLANLDMAKIRTSPGHNKVSNIDEKARQLRDYLKVAIQTLASVQKAPAAFTPDNLPEQREGIRQRVEDFRNAPAFVTDAVKSLRDRMVEFQRGMHG